MVAALLPRRTAVQQHRRHQIQTLPRSFGGVNAAFSEQFKFQGVQSINRSKAGIGIEPS